MERVIWAGVRRLVGHREQTQSGTPVRVRGMCKRARMTGRERAQGNKVQCGCGEIHIPSFHRRREVYVGRRGEAFVQGSGGGPIATSTGTLAKQESDAGCAIEFVLRRIRAAKLCDDSLRTVCSGAEISDTLRLVDL